MAKQIADTAKDFLASLNPEQKGKAVFALTDPERPNWNFVPMERKGITLQELSPDQDHLAYALLQSFLSHEGFRKIAAIMSLEAILADLEKNPQRRNPEKYHLLVFGEPDAVKPWGFRFEGHHCSLSATMAAGSVSVTPTFLGANPGEVPEGRLRAGLRVLADEEDLGRKLALSLTDEQKKEALLPGEVPADVLTTNKQRVEPLSPAGIPTTKLDAAQRALVWEIIAEYTGRFRPEIAQAAEARLKAAGDAALTFAWSGSTVPAEGHYYRIQSPDFLFEYDNTQNGAKHPHAVWRDFKGDFGEDILAAHLREAHGH